MNILKLSLVILLARVTHGSEAGKQTQPGMGHAHHGGPRDEPHKDHHKDRTDGHTQTSEKGGLTYCVVLNDGAVTEALTPGQLDEIYANGDYDGIMQGSCAECCDAGDECEAVDGNTIVELDLCDTVDGGHFLRH